MRNKKIILLISLIVTLLIMAGGYAVYSTQLKISGTGSIDSNFNIEVTGIEEESKKGKAVSVTEPTYTSSTATFNTKLQRPGDNIEYEVEITNNGTVDGKINAINITNTSEIVSVETRGIIEGEIIKSGEVKEYIVRVYIEESAKITEDVTSTVEVNTEIVQDDNQIFNNNIDGVEENKIAIESTKEESTCTNIIATVIAKGNGLKYYYSLDGEEWTEASTSNAYTFTGLEIGTRYTVYYKVEDKNLNYVTESKWINTKDVDAPVITIANEKEWTESKEVTIEYPEIEGAKYEYKIGEGNWIETELNKETITVEENTKIYAKVKVADKEKIAEKEITKIDGETPTLTLSTSKTSNSITVVANAEAISGIAKYEYSIDGETWIDNEKYNTYTFKDLIHNKEYEIKVRVTNKVGKEEIILIKETTNLIETPTFNEEVDGEVEIIYPEGCNSKYVCSYIKDDGEEVIVTENPKVIFDTNGTLVAKVTDGINYITSSTYTVERTNLYVASTGNDETGYGTIAAPYATLNKAYDSSSLTQESTIYVMDNIEVSETALFDEDKTITLTSTEENNNVLTRNNMTSHILKTTGGEITLENITFDGKEQETTNTLVRIENSVFTMNENTIIQNNITTTDEAGGIALRYSTATINGGKILNNTAQAGGGGGLHSRLSDVVINDVEISGNTASDGGGGIFFGDTGNTLTLNGGIISVNESSSNGGGIEVSSSNIIINNGKISGNTATVNGGGILVSTNEAIDGNYHGTAEISGGTIEGNSAFNGAGIRNSGSLNIYDGTITGNNSSNHGGGISNSGLVILSGGTISDNTAKEGGGLFNQGTLEIRNGEIINNYAEIGAGGCYIHNNGIGNMSSGVIKENSATYGSGVYLWGSGVTFTMTGGIIEKNTSRSTVHGGAVIIDSSATFILDGGTIRNNTAPTGSAAGGIINWSNNTNYTYKSGIVCGNTPSNSYETHTTCPS